MSRTFRREGGIVGSEDDMLAVVFGVYGVRAIPTEDQFKGKGGQVGRAGRCTPYGTKVIYAHGYEHLSEGHQEMLGCVR